MSFKACFMIAILFFATAGPAFPAGGEKVVVHLKNGEQKKGELEAVSDSSLTISRWKPGAEYADEIKFCDIKEVVFKSKPEVSVFLKSGKKMSGFYLAAVRDSAVVLQYGRKLNQFNSVCNFHEIEQIIIEGHSKIFSGMCWGGLAGGGFGMLIGLASGDDPPGFMSFSAESKAAIAGIYLGGTGIAVGGAVGAIISTRDQNLESLSDKPFALLHGFVRSPQRYAKN